MKDIQCESPKVAETFRSKFGGEVKGNLYIPPADVNRDEVMAFCFSLPREPKRIKWNITQFPQLTHFIVAPNMKYRKVHTILSVGTTKRIVKNLMEVV